MCASAEIHFSGIKESKLSVNKYTFGALNIQLYSFKKYNTSRIYDFLSKGICGKKLYYKKDYMYISLV